MDPLTLLRNAATGDLGSPVLEAGARAICRRHQNEIRGLTGDALEDYVDRIYLGYVSEAKNALLAMLRVAGMEIKEQPLETY